MHSLENENGNGQLMEDRGNTTVAASSDGTASWDHSINNLLAAGIDQRPAHCGDTAAAPTTGNVMQQGQNARCGGRARGSRNNTGRRGRGGNRRGTAERRSSDLNCLHDRLLRDPFHLGGQPAIGPNQDKQSAMTFDPAQYSAAFMAAMASLANIGGAGSLPNNTASQANILSSIQPPAWLMPGCLDQTSFFDRIPLLLDQMSQSAVNNGMYRLGAAVPFHPSALASYASGSADEAHATDRDDDVKDMIVDDAKQDQNQPEMGNADRSNVSPTNGNRRCNKSMEAVIAKLTKNLVGGSGDVLPTDQGSLSSRMDQYSIRDLLSRTDETARQDNGCVNHQTAGDAHSADGSIHQAHELPERQTLSRRTSFTTDDRDSDGLNETCGSTAKRRRKPEEPDENLIRLPLMLGWQRKTHVRSVTKTGVRGDVVYFSPDQRKLKSFQEIDRYLLRSGTHNLTRQNFTFSSKLLVGTFVQHERDEEENIVSEEVSEEEIIRQIKQINPDFQRSLPNKLPNLQSPNFPSDRRKKARGGANQRRTTGNNRVQGDSLRRNSQATDGGQADFTQGRASAGLCDPGEINPVVAPLNCINSLGDLIPSSMAQAAGNFPFLNESLLNYQSLLMSTGKCQSDVLPSPGWYSAALSNSVHNDMPERKPTTNENVSSTNLAAILLAKQKRLKMIEMAMNKELKTSVDDLLIREEKPLPDLQPVPDVFVSQQAFADCLVVIEFLSSFLVTLKIDRTLIPDIGELQRSLLSSEADETCYFKICSFLLRTAFTEGGTPNGRRPLMVLGQRASEFELNVHTISELLRLFIVDRTGEDEISKALATASVFELRPCEKAHVLSYLCNELLSSRMLSECIDSNLETLGQLRRRKWMIEGLVRKLRSEICKSDADHPHDDASSLTTAADPAEQSQHMSATEECHDDDVKASESADDLDRNLEHGPMSAEPSDSEDHLDESDTDERLVVDVPPHEADGLTPTRHLTNGEIERQIEENLSACELIKKTINQRNSLMRCSQLGQDRYFRRYWLFPRLAAIYVEGGQDEDGQTIHDSECMSDIEDGSPIPLEEETTDTCPEEVLECIRAVRSDYASTEDANCEVVDLALSRRLRSWVFTVVPILRNLFHIKAQYLPIDGHVINNVEGRGESSAGGILQNGQVEPITEEEAERLVRAKLHYDEPQPVPHDMQRGWWIIKEMGTVQSLLTSLLKRGIREKNLYRNLNRSLDQIGLVLSSSSDDVVQSTKLPEPLELVKSCSFPGDGINAALIESLYSLEDRVIAASLQARGMMIDERTKELNEADSVKIAKDRLALLERIIERRYFKQPFVRKMDTSMLGSTGTDEDQTVSMERWRRAVKSATSASQLFLCITQLDKHLAWEKSIMRVICQICNKDENEDRLLLCDGCDKGHHTYCFRPPITKIPDGDWFCNGCEAKKRNQSLCFICANGDMKAGAGELLYCERCRKPFHADCHQGAYITRNRCQCLVCHSSTKTSKRLRTEDKSEGLRRRESSPPAHSPEPKKGASRLYDSILPVSKKRRAAGNAEDRNAAWLQQKCRELVAELSKHQSSWPFREPVDEKIYPEYYDVIKHPMDLQSIKKKARLNQYTSADEFASDVRRIFENCHFYNEDESSIGKAGMEMRLFFEKRFQEIFFPD